MTSHPLKDRLAGMRRRIRRMMLCYGWSWILAVLCGTLLIVGLSDWLVHWDDAGVRLILGLGTLGLAGWTAYRFLWQPLQVRINDEDLALRIETRYPELRDSLASTVQFLEQGADPRLGSPALQQQVIDKTLREVEQLDFEQIIETHPVRRVGAVAIALLLIVGILAGFNRLQAATALKRLMFPFSANPWPRQTALRIVKGDFTPLRAEADKPLLVARGSALEFFVINVNGSGQMPPNVRLEYRVAGEPVISEPLPRVAQRKPDGEAQEVASGSLTAKAPLVFRAVGGDDEGMDWIPVEVVPPPVLDSLQVTLTPPAYLKQPAVKLPPGTGHVEGYIGTRVEITGHANKPLATAVLHLKDNEHIPIALDADGKTVKVEFVLKDPGSYSYWLDLKDKQSFDNQDAPRYEIRATPDLVPDVAIELPATDLQITPSAEVPLKIVAKDDLGLSDIRVPFEVVADSQSKAAPADPLSLLSGTDRPKQSAVEHLWNLATLNLKAGSQVVFHAEARDDFDLGEPHVGKSSPRTLTVVSPETKSRELADRQATILEHLERASKLQAAAQAQVGQLQLQLQKAGELRPEDLDLLQRVEMQQRQVTEQLKNTTDGTETLARRVLEELARNHLQEPETQARMEQVTEEIARLGSEQLPVIEQELTQVRKDALTRNPTGKAGTEKPQSKDNAKKSESPAEKAATTGENKAADQTQQSPATSEKPAAKESADTNKEKSEKSDQPSAGETAPKADPKRDKTPTGGESLAKAADGQRVVHDTLTDLLKELGQWQEQRDIVRDLTEIKSDQQAIQKDSTELGAKTVSKPVAELSPQDQADLARLAERQRAQAEKLQELQKKMDRVLEGQKPDQKEDSESLKDAREFAEQAALANRMQDAAQRIGENQVGEAAQAQKQIGENLQELDDILHDRRETDSEALQRKLKAAEQSIEQLEKKQAELKEQGEATKNLPDEQAREQAREKIVPEQGELADQTQQMSRQIKRLQADKAGESAQRAASRMQQAEQKLREQKPGETAEQQQEALDDLEQTRRELAATRKELEEKAAQEKFARMGEELQQMLTRQQQILDETRQLEEARAAKGNFNRAQLKTLRDLTETQRSLQQATQEMAETLAAAEVFSMALNGAAKQMETAAGLLAERQTALPTQYAERAARKRFEDLLAALKEEPSKKKPQQPQQPQAGGEQQAQQEQPQQQPGIPPLPQLKMLRSLQQELIQRTADLQAERNAEKEMTPAQQKRMENLAEEQAELADLARRLFEQAMNNAQPQPTAPPTEEKQP